MENTGFDPVLWSNIIAASAVVAYGYFLWVQSKGLVRVSPRVRFRIRVACLFCILMPIAARLYLSASTLLFLGIAVVICAVLIKIRNQLGL